MKINGLIVVFSLFLLGCAGINDFYVSKSVDDGGIYKNWSNGVVKIQLENIGIYIKPDNAQLFRDGLLVWPHLPITGTSAPVNAKYVKSNFLNHEGDNFDEKGVYVDKRVYGDYFYVEFCMRAEEENIVFNPLEVYLQLEDGESVQASKYIKPEMKVGAPNPNWGVEFLIQGSSKDSYEWAMEKYERNSSQYFDLPKGKWIGFAIRFETLTPSPGTAFNIKIMGLKERENIISIPEVIFKDKKIYRDVHQ